MGQNHPHCICATGVMNCSASAQATYRPFAGKRGSQDDVSRSREPPSRWLGSNPREET